MTTVAASAPAALAERPLVDRLLALLGAPQATAALVGSLLLAALIGAARRALGARRGSVSAAVLRGDMRAVLDDDALDERERARRIGAKGAKWAPIPLMRAAAVAAIVRSKATLSDVWAELRAGGEAARDGEALAARVAAREGVRSGAPRARLAAAALRLVDVARVRDELLRTGATALDGDSAAHAALLARLWAVARVDGAYERFGKHWGVLGFQGKDPASDLRGSGVLALEQLVFYFERHGDDAQRALLTAQFGNGVDGHGFPFACAGIQVTRMLLDALRDGELDDLLLRREPTPDTFHELFSGTMSELARQYEAYRPKNVMDFGPFFKQFSARREW